MVSFSLLIILKPFGGGLVQPLPKRLPGVVYARPSKPCCWGGKWLRHVGDVVSLCLASQKPSQREFFGPTGTDLCVKLII